MNQYKKVNKLIKIISRLFIINVCVLVLSCATFREGGIQSFDGKILKHELLPKKKIALIIQGQLIDNGIEVPEKYIQKYYTKYWIESSEEAYKVQRIFSSVYVVKDRDKKPIDADFISQVNIRVEKNYNSGLGLINFLTLTLVPYKESIKITVVTSIYDKSDKLLKAYKRSEGVTIWNQLLMIFVVPFTKMHELRDEGAVYSEIYYDANMDIIRQAHEDEIF